MLEITETGGRMVVTRGIVCGGLLFNGPGVLVSSDERILEMNEKWWHKKINILNII